MVIISNDCSDHSDILLDLISKELKDIEHIDVTKEPLGEQSVGQRTFAKFKKVLKENKNQFALPIDIDEYICSTDPSLTELSSIKFAEDKSYLFPWVNCIPEKVFDFENEPVFVRNSRAITKKNYDFPYLNGYAGKHLRFNKNNIDIANFHHFSENGVEIKDGERCSVYLKHCVINTLDEFILRSERGESATYAKDGQNIVERENNAFKYSIDLFLMYLSQQTTPNIDSNPKITAKAKEIKDKLLLKADIKSAQNKIDAYYKRKFSRIKKSYIPTIFRALDINHIQGLKTKELEKFNKQFFKSSNKKPHDYYVLMSLAYLFENNHKKARLYATEGLMVYASYKLLLLAQSSILHNPYYSVP